MGTEAVQPGKSAPPEPLPADLLASIEKLIQTRVTQMAPHLGEHERQDALQAARKEGWIAATRYDRSYGTRFSTFAVPHITGGIAGYLRGEVRQTKLKQRMWRLSAGYLAEEPDDFDVMYDDDATLAGRLQVAANRHVAAMALGLAQSPADPEEAASERRDRAIAAPIVARVLEQATPEQHAIVTLRYGEGRSMKDIAAATGKPARTLRWHHDKLLDALHAAIVAAGLDEPPGEE